MNAKWKLFLLTGLASLSLGLPVSAATTGTTTASVRVLGGGLELTSPSATADLGNFTIDGTTKTLAINLGTMPVADLTGTGRGWNITAQATQFSDGTNQLPQNSLVLTGINGITADGTSSGLPTAVGGSSYILDSGTAQRIVTAASGTGMGKYNVGLKPLALTVNTSELKASNNDYTSTITYTMVTGP